MRNSHPLQRQIRMRNSHATETANLDAGLPATTTFLRNAAQACGKMAEKRGLLRERKASDLCAAAPYIENHFDGVINMRLGVDTAGDREAQQVHGAGLLHAVLIALAEHERANFHGTNAAFEIQLGGKRDARKLRGRNVRQKRARINV